MPVKITKNKFIICAQKNNYKFKINKSSHNKINNYKNNNNNKYNNYNKKF